MEVKVISEPVGKQQQELVWEKSPSQVFWGEIATCDHAVQLYENDKVFLNTLESFAGAGLIAGDSVIIIATAEHLAAIETRLINQGFNMHFLVSANRYIALNAEDTLKKFMISEQINEGLFMDCITKVIHRGQKNTGKIRAFGEMVAVLWQRGLREATIELERLWNKLHHKDNFTLFCAYPKNIFNGDINTSIHAICSEHHKMIDGAPRPSTEVYYKQIA